MEDAVYNIVNPQSKKALILTCEHAGALVPEKYALLGIPKAEFDRHIARDKGGLEVTTQLAARLGCCAVMGKYSRLLIDLNRRENEAELIVEESDGTIIAGNSGLSEQEKKHRIDTYYRPYYQAIENQIMRLQKMGKRPIIFSIHSYTPQLKGGTYRPWQAGILYHNPTQLAKYLYDGLRQRCNKIIGENVPYDLRCYNTGAAVVCGEEKGFDYALIEIRDDEFSQLEQGAREWERLLGDLLEEYSACA